MPWAFERNFTRGYEDQITVYYYLKIEVPVSD